MTATESGITVEQIVADLLSENGPMTAGDLIAHICTSPTPSEVQHAFWRMIQDGRVQLDADLLLRIDDAPADVRA